MRRVGNFYKRLLNTQQQHKTIKTEEYLDNFNYEMAQLFCQRALDMDPTNLDILDMMGSICMELGHAEKAKAAGFPDEMEVTTKDIAAAFCSVAEIYFTDLCMEEAASERCKGAIQKALEYDPTNSEALQLMASYLFSMDQPQRGSPKMETTDLDALDTVAYARPTSKEAAMETERMSLITLKPSILPTKPGSFQGTM
ncbi:hypothetical protein XELAEV_18030840mg [Xenopus laevis]|uniref:Uncharacterized protein n=1 Tax=Xenopus laevis TaxID=8355 RepID=A0A974CNV4_XENLA|nr:hypothetical protein XELAEV_18030840mg [Xenopus laevis]